MKREKSTLNTCQIISNVTPELKAIVEEHCRKNGMSIAEWVRCCAAKLAEEKWEREKKKP